RIETEKSRGVADRQSELAASQVLIEIATNNARAKRAEAEGVAAFTVATGKAEAEVIEAKGNGEAAAGKAVGLARATGFKAQADALGQGATAIVAVANEISDGKIKVVPDVLVTNGSSLDALAASLVGSLSPAEARKRVSRAKQSEAPQT